MRDNQLFAWFNVCSTYSTLSDKTDALPGILQKGASMSQHSGRSGALPGEVSKITMESRVWKMVFPNSQF